MTEAADPVFNPKQPSIEVRDRALPNVAYQQGDSLFDRKKMFVRRTDLVLHIPEPEKPVVTVRDIAQRVIGHGNRSERVKDPERTGTQSTEGVGSPYKRHNSRLARAAGTKSVESTVRAVARENSQARSAESLA